MAADGAENIRVAVRVRPFNDRERERGAKCIIRMNGNSTELLKESGSVEKKFTFDFRYVCVVLGQRAGVNTLGLYSYWSFDDNHPKPATQAVVMEDLGMLYLDAAWEGEWGSLGHKRAGVQLTVPCALWPRQDSIAPSLRTARQAPASPTV